MTHNTSILSDEGSVTRRVERPTALEYAVCDLHNAAHAVKQGSLKDAYMEAEAAQRKIKEAIEAEEEGFYSAEYKAARKALMDKKNPNFEQRDGRLIYRIH